MEDDKAKTSHPRDRGELSFGWQLLLMTAPEFWIPGLIAFLGIKVFGIPEELGPAVFFVFLIVLLMLTSGLAVYFLGRSFKRGKCAPERSAKRRE